MINRRLKDAGVEPLLAYIILIVAFIGLSAYLFHKTEFAGYIYVLFPLMLAGKLSESRRTEFIKLCFGDRKLKEIRILENLIIATPFLIFLIYKQLFVLALVLVILTTLLALANFRTPVSVTIPTPFSKRPFEFTTGFRNSFYLVFAAYALTIIAVSVGNFNLGIFSMLLVFAITLGYYAKPEHPYYVWSFSLNPKMFLIHKKNSNALFFFTCFAGRINFSDFFSR